MKKSDIKLIVITLVIAAATAFSAVSVSADYYNGYKPDSPAPVSNTGNNSNTGNDPADAVGVVTETTVESKLSDAVKSGAEEVTLKVSESTEGKVTVQEAVLADIVKSGVTVTLEITPEEGTAYSVTIDPSTVTEATAINVAMDITINAAGSQVSDVDIPSNSVVIAPQQKGEFGMELTVTIPAKALTNIDIDNASLFYIGDDGSVKKLDSQLAVNADGSISVTISHASAYVISSEELGYVEPDDDDDDADDIDDEDADDSDDDDADTSDPDDAESICDDPTDSNPGTGVGIAFGALAAFASAAVITAKKRK